MKKLKWLTLLLVLVLALPACGGENLSAPDGHSGDVLRAEMAGMEIAKPKTYTENKDKMLLDVEGYEADTGLHAMLIYLYPDTMEHILAMDEDEYNRIMELELLALSIFRVDSSWSEEDFQRWLQNEGIFDLSLLEVVEENKDYTCYTCFDKNYSADLPEELKPVYDGILAELDEARKHVVHSEPLDEARVNEGKVLNFTTTDVNGNTVTSQELFSQNKYTMVNCWASWCGPCVGEMPELETLSKEFQEKGCAIMGLLIDGNDAAGLADALEIIQETGVTYANIVPWEGMDDLLTIQAVPTSFFVDPDGNIVGEAIVGADLEQYESVLNQLLG